MGRLAKIRLTFVGVGLMTAAALSAQVVRSGGPPPEVRAILDGVVAALNSGSAEAWEAFAQARFAPSLLQKQSREERAEHYRSLADRFGTVALGRVTRQGPDAPMELNVKGTRAAGVIVLELDGGSPPRIAALRAGAGEPARDDPAVPPPPIDGSLDAGEIDRRLDGYFSKLAADQVFSGVALVARDGVPVFFKAYGLADREKNIPNTIRTRFNLGSINKAFTQAAIRQLVAAGKLSYSDTLGKFFPGSNIDMHGVSGSAAGGGYSTALDLLAYVKAVRAGRFPGANPDVGIAGGAPGINAIIESSGAWTVIVLANLDPPAAGQVGMAVAGALAR